MRLNCSKLVSFYVVNQLSSSYFWKMIFHKFNDRISSNFQELWITFRTMSNLKLSNNIFLTPLCLETSVHHVLSPWTNKLLTEIPIGKSIIRKIQSWYYTNITRSVLHSRNIAYKKWKHVSCRHDCLLDIRENGLQLDSVNDEPNFANSS